MLSRSLLGACFAVLLAAPATAFAGGTLVVAGDQPAPQPVRPAPSALSPDTFSEPEAEIEREGVSLGGSFYLFSGAAVDDFQQGGFVIRPELELYASFGLGDVSMILGGTVLGVEATHFSNRDGISIPMLATVGVRDDSWLVALAGGVSVADDDSYGDDIEDDEESMPSPRGEVRVGYRFLNLVELTGIVGAQRRMFTNREDATRLIFGLSIGIGGDDNQKNKKAAF